MVLEEIKQKTTKKNEPTKEMTIDRFLMEMMIAGGMMEFKAKKWFGIAERSGYLIVDHKKKTVKITDAIIIDD